MKKSRKGRLHHARSGCGGAHILAKKVWKNSERVGCITPEVDLEVPILAKKVWKNPERVGYIMPEVDVEAPILAEKV